MRTTYLIIYHVIHSQMLFLVKEYTPTILPVSKLVIDTFSVKAIMAWVVLCRFLNPYCLLYRMSWLSRKSIIESATIF